MNDPYFAQTDGTQQQPPVYFPPPGNNKPRPAGKKPNMTWLKYGGAALAGLLIGVVIGMSGQGPLAEELEQVKADSQESLVAAKEDAQDKTDALEDQLAGKDAEIDEAEFRAQKAEDRVDDRLAGLEEIESELKDLRAQLDKREGDLDSRESDITATENQILDNTITDGTWLVGTDFDPGTYRAAGGGLCYWARLGSTDTFDILDNGLGKNPTVTLSAGEWFETSDCGDWTALGG